jgi:hypothetical protein
MQEEIHGDIYVVNEQFASDGNAIVPIWVNVINLDDFLVGKTPTNLGNTSVKWKGNNVFSPIIEASNKSYNAMVEAMDHINATHIEITNRWNIVHKCTFKEHLQCLK